MHLFLPCCLEGWGDNIIESYVFIVLLICCLGEGRGTFLVRSGLFLDVLICLLLWSLLMKDTVFLFILRLAIYRHIAPGRNSPGMLKKF